MVKALTYFRGLETALKLKQFTISSKVTVMSLFQQDTSFIGNAIFSSLNGLKRV
jgi:hypothetical protein